MLQSLGKLTGDAAMLRAAEAAYRNALLEYARELAPMDWAMTQNNLGSVLHRLGDLTGDADMLRQAEAAFRDALSEMTNGDAEDSRQGAAASLARLLVNRGGYADARAVIEPALDLSDLAIMDAGRSRDGVARAVEQVGDLFGLLSQCYLRQERIDIAAALVAAEAGRARLLTYAMARDMVRLEDIEDPEIRAQVEAARVRREALRYRLGYSQAAGEVQYLELPAEERERLRTELRQATDAYIALCRRHGLIRRFIPLTADEIFAAAPKGGALVLPVLNDADAFAFIVAAAPQAAVVDLPRFDRRIVASHLSDDGGWQEVYRNHFQVKKGKDPVAQARWRAQLTVTQAWLWERLLGPIHLRLEEFRDEHRWGGRAPVVLLSPGLLGLLPLHAAGPDPDGRHFGDHWTVSYAPSVRAFSACLQRLAQRQALETKLLAIFDPPSTDGAPALPSAAQEEHLVRQRFGHARQVILRRDEVTLGAVLHHLPDATCFHASTHGWHDPLQPNQSGLLLAGPPLRLEALDEAVLKATRLVFLSACESGLASVTRLPDEFIGLPAGFVQAGAACVVASLWPIHDDAALLLASRFYDLYLDEHANIRLPVADALRAAQNWLRTVSVAELRCMFSTDASGKMLVLQAALRMMPAGVAEDAADRGASSESTADLSLTPGSNDDRPYAAAEHWAAFTVTGA